MSRKKCNLMIFSIGALGYGLIEILWRGYTHWSMLFAGGFAFLGLSAINNRMRSFSVVLKAFAGGFLITAVEFVFGFIFNILLKKNVWDYSRMPFNLKGQICATYSLFWVLLSAVAVPFAGIVSKRLRK